jgi:uncharacterized membrane protein YccC
LRRDPVHTGRAGESMKAIRRFVVSSEHPTSITHAARTAAGAVVSLLIARLFRLPEAYWAPITAIVVMQSTLAAAISNSAQRFAGTAVGAAAGALAAIYFPGSTLVFGLMVLVVGTLCAAFHVDRSAYRYAGITLAIVVLPPHAESPWVIAIHRFAEVSLGIAVGLAFMAAWPERQSGQRTSR